MPSHSFPNGNPPESSLFARSESHLLNSKCNLVPPPSSGLPLYNSKKDSMKERRSTQGTFLQGWKVILFGSCGRFLDIAGRTLNMRSFTRVEHVATFHPSFGMHSSAKIALHTTLLTVDHECDYTELAPLGVRMCVRDFTILSFCLSIHSPSLHPRSCSSGQGLCLRMCTDMFKLTTRSCMTFQPRN